MLQAVDVHVRHLRSVVVLDLAGDVTGGAGDELTAAYQVALTYAPDAVLLDFAHVEYIDSTGIAVLVSVLAEARSDGCRLAACGLTDHYCEIFAITRLSDFIELFDDEQSALRQLAA